MSDLLTTMEIIVGILLLLVWGAIIISDAFSKSFLWWLACFFTPLTIIYVILNWHDTKKPFIAYVVGIVLLHMNWFLL